MRVMVSHQCLCETMADSDEPCYAEAVQSMRENRRRRGIHLGDPTRERNERNGTERTRASERPPRTLIH